MPWWWEQHGAGGRQTTFINIHYIHMTEIWQCHRNQCRYSGQHSSGIFLYYNMFYYICLYPALFIFWPCLHFVSFISKVARKVSKEQLKGTVYKSYLPYTAVKHKKATRMLSCMVQQREMCTPCVKHTVYLEIIAVLIIR